MENFFTMDDFEVNSTWKVHIIPFQKILILYIHDIYKNPYRVYEYLKQAPIKTHKDVTKDSVNGKDFADGQHLVDNRWDVSRLHLYDKIREFYGITVEGGQVGHGAANTDDHLVPFSRYNQFRLNSDHPGEDKFFHPHQDNIINCCTYLNPDVGDHAGTVLYSTESSDPCDELEHEKPWRTMDDGFRPELSIMSKFNCMAVFPGQIYHGQNIVGNHFKEQTRFTEVVFF
tara:strand:+ start:38 stop:724 length:687 start_codon:yes stop_codon:yes gene_type:complete